ncbi:gamma carbonic anhydrase family protein [Rhodococcus sp. WMMA185]|uniref:gamma carbonic anhydrase family protein n=1 Tax=Rhodococcus sp. WMMA185 TaxID=679318 RepID=UPI000878A708|nr:gamma carbonic anhydrase family protein [Rhodococcus sp. WMMA185]AOW91667.1 gamma carbonic anhydrase family protein [Rhodococcus sp. WMMA185]
MRGPHVAQINGKSPRADETAFVAPTATVIGAATIGAEASVWYGAVLRADCDSIALGEGSNIQDGVAVHCDPGFPVTVGRNVSVGHNAVLHGCTVEDGALVGMGATVLNGAVVGTGSLIAAGALVLAGTQIPPRSLVAGVPAKVRRELTDDEVAKNEGNAAVYRHLAQQHRSAEVTAFDSP